MFSAHSIALKQKFQNKVPVNRVNTSHDSLSACNQSHALNMDFLTEVHALNIAILGKQQTVVPQCIGFFHRG